ncbi:MAG: class I SAM-dependent methyltransferase [Nanoarchaeota archaeon]|nr:class I SAM-dependent methyltransferase [Nanoarchaeota archaeon]MBU1028048.1 class I SAM-dependent methyltransferase [Nanoarchaeota archaeon]
MDQHNLLLKFKLEKVASLIKPNSVVLDIGCYDGRLKKFIPSCDYYGIDVNKECIDKLKKQRIKAKQVDLNKEEIPFKPKKFDYIFLLDILEHLVDPKKLLLKLKERLKPHSKLIITLPNDYHILNKIRFLFNKSLTENPFNPFGHLHFFPISFADSFLKEQGYEILKKEFLAPVKPLILPKGLKNILSNLFPQTFSRNILYAVKLS